MRCAKDRVQRSFRLTEESVQIRKHSQPSGRPERGLTGVMNRLFHFILQHTNQSYHSPPLFYLQTWFKLNNARTCSRYGLRHIVDGHTRCLVFFSGIRTGIHVTSPSWDVQNVAVRRSNVTVLLLVTCLKLIAVTIQENENSKNLSGCEYNSLHIYI